MALIEQSLVETAHKLSAQVPAPYSNPQIRDQSRRRDIIVIYGPAGCGKSSLAQVIADEFGFTYIEGDEVRLLCSFRSCCELTDGQHHPEENIAKMAASIPLGDADRWDWLIRLREVAVQALELDDNSGVVLTCSALKRKYRDVIRIASLESPGIRLHFMYLEVELFRLKMRLLERKGHYMSYRMMESQLRDLERVDERETDIISIDVNGPRDESRRSIIAAVKFIQSSV